uniref:Uncharacterized protein n=1 Tax=Daphnia galeata TaxID=27404 RepID=A0A8J2RIT5_9CRUS|nr:unnamed protein product [Daphnia galeata]
MWNDYKFKSENVKSSKHCELPSVHVDLAKPTVDNLQHLAADFVLNMLTEQKLTQVNVQYVMEAATTLINETVKHRLQEYISFLETNNHDRYAQITLLDYKEDPFVLLRNQCGQNKYFATHFGMIETVRIDLPFGAADYRRHRTGRRQSFKVKDYFYVPLLKQLEKILNFTDVYDEVMLRKPVKKNEFSYFENGSAFNENTLFQLDITAIQFQLFLDEASTTADKGNRSKKNKLMFVYFTLGNIDVKHRSTFKSINLLSKIGTETVKRFGLNVLLKPIVDDLKKLEEGVPVTIKGKRVLVRGTLSAVIADNLGSHQIGGFKIGFAKGFRKCRFCMATDEQIQSLFLDALFQPRKREHHDEQCASLANAELREHFERVYGITDQLNNKIENFKYGYSEVADKPCSIEYKQLIGGKMSQTAAQLLLLAVNLPIMISSFIDEYDPVWHCFTVLLRICRLVFLDSISKFQVVLLEDLIEEFLVAYKDNFFQSYKKNNPKSVLKCRITPKSTIWCTILDLLSYWVLLNRFGACALKPSTAILSLCKGKLKILSTLHLPLNETSTVAV